MVLQNNSTTPYTMEHDYGPCEDLSLRNKSRISERKHGRDQSRIGDGIMVPLTFLLIHPAQASCGIHYRPILLI